MWDNHEFSWQGRQSIQQAGGPPRPGQTVKVAANQAWFEYIPARVTRRAARSTDSAPPAVKNVKIEKWDENGLGHGAQQPHRDPQPDRLSRAPLRQAPRPPHHRPAQLLRRATRPIRRGVGKIYDPAFNGMFSEEAMIALDAGAPINGGKPPAELRFRDARIPNPRKDSAAADDPRRRAEGLVQGPAAQVDRDVENLGQFARRARLTHRSAKPPGRHGRKALAARHLRNASSTDYGAAYARADGNLRPGPRREDHRLRDRFRRSPQLLGGLCGGRASAAASSSLWA